MSGYITLSGRVLTWQRDAVLFAGAAGETAWLPRQWLSVEDLGTTVRITMPRWLADEKHLTAGDPGATQGRLL